MSDYFTLQIKLYPTPIQKKILAQTVGASRWVYNYFLDKKIKAYEDTGKGLTYFQTANLLPKLKSQHLWFAVSSLKVIYRRNYGNISLCYYVLCNA